MIPRTVSLLCLRSVNRSHSLCRERSQAGTRDGSSKSGMKPTRRTELGVPAPDFEIKLITGNAGNDESYIAVAACTASAWPAERAPLVRCSRCWLVVIKVSLCKWYGFSKALGGPRCRGKPRGWCWRLLALCPLPACVRMNLYVSLSMGNRTEQVSPDQCDGVLGLYAHVRIGMRMPVVV